MPPDMSSYCDADHPFDILIQQDGTGFGALSLTQQVLKNPLLSHSAKTLRKTGVGLCGDGREGTTRLMGEANRTFVNSVIRARGAYKFKHPRLDFARSTSASPLWLTWPASASAKG